MAILVLSSIYKERDWGSVCNTVAVVGHICLFKALYLGLCALLLCYAVFRNTNHPYSTVHTGHCVVGFVPSSRGSTKYDDLHADADGFFLFFIIFFSRDKSWSAQRPSRPEKFRLFADGSVPQWEYSVLGPECVRMPILLPSAQPRRHLDKTNRRSRPGVRVEGTSKSTGLLSGASLAPSFSLKKAKGAKLLVSKFAALNDTINDRI